MDADLGVAGDHVGRAVVAAVVEDADEADALSRCESGRFWGAIAFFSLWIAPNTFGAPTFAMKSSIETQDQRTLARARVEAGEVWK